MAEQKKQPDARQKTLLKSLPGVDRMLELAASDPDFETAPKSVITRSVRQVLDQYRTAILKNDAAFQEDVAISEKRLLQQAGLAVQSAMRDNLIPVINATGVVVHTNLGRSLLAKSALDHILSISGTYSNLEFDLPAGGRGLRYSLVEELICEISGAEAALAVNNNAGAVLVCLDTIAHNREVIVSRGELVEIGGSFRIPDVMAKSGALLKEVGTTNRTHPQDYRRAITENTGLLLKVHTSNFGIIGFTSSVSLPELVEIGRQQRLPVMEDLGSGTFIDFSRYGLLKEPTVGESVAAGADVVTFSGDKLLGGPQAGIIVGTKSIVDKIKQNPLTRALRIDKLTLAALESTLRLYREEEVAVSRIPTLNMITAPLEMIEQKAEHLKNLLEDITNKGLSVEIADSTAKAGGGSFPLLEIPSRCVRIRVKGKSANQIEAHMRNSIPPIIGRIEEDVFLMDIRTVLPEQLQDIARAVTAFAEGI